MIFELKRISSLCIPNFVLGNFFIEMKLGNYRRLFRNKIFTNNMTDFLRKCIPKIENPDQKTNEL